MQIRHRLIGLAAALFALPFIYGGCVIIIGSGDDDNDKDDSEQQEVLVVAAVNSENAVEFAAGAVAGGPISGVPTDTATGSDPGPIPENGFRTLRLPLTLAGAIERIQPHPSVVSLSRFQTVAEEGTVTGACGGQFAYAVDFNRETESFSGEMVFRDYCEDRLAISNRSSVNGSFDRSSGKIDSARFSFEDLSADGLSHRGELHIDFFADALEAFLRIDTARPGSGELFILSDYTVEINRYAGFEELEVHGRYTHPVHGTVELATTEPFVIHPEDPWPDSGAAVVNGSDATAAELTSVDFTRFRVAADTGGAGFMNRSLGIHPWERTAPR